MLDQHTHQEIVGKDVLQMYCLLIITPSAHSHLLAQLINIQDAKELLLPALGPSNSQGSCVSQA